MEGGIFQEEKKHTINTFFSIFSLRGGFFFGEKAIRDGVIDATLDHEEGSMKSAETLDVYSTNEPQAAFHQRISFCLSLHNESVKALRFPLGAVGSKKLGVLSGDEDKEDEAALERKLVKEILEDEDEEMGEF